jgi:hypothetical protein
MISDLCESNPPEREAKYTTVRKYINEHTSIIAQLLAGSYVSRYVT